MRAGRPVLPRCTDLWSGDEMIDGVSGPTEVCLRPLVLWRPSRPEAWRQTSGGSRPQSICGLVGRGRARELGGLGGSCGRLLVLRVGLEGGERVVAEFAQDLVGAAAELARDREAGAVVVDPLGDLLVVGVVGGGAP